MWHVALVKAGVSALSPFVVSLSLSLSLSLPLSLSLSLSPPPSPFLSPSLKPTAVAEFVQKLSTVEDQHAQQLNNLVRNFRRKTQETFRKDP